MWTRGGQFCGLWRVHATANPTHICAGCVDGGQNHGQVTVCGAPLGAGFGPRGQIRTSAVRMRQTIGDGLRYRR
jgi:hypothetical protein